MKKGKQVPTEGGGEHGCRQRVTNPWSKRRRTSPADTLLLVSNGGALGTGGHYPAIGDVHRSLTWVDGVHWQEVMTADGPTAIEFGADLGMGPGRLDDMPRIEIERLTGRAPLSRGDMLRLTEGKARNIEVRDPRLLESLITDLREAGVPPALVLVTSDRDDIPPSMRLHRGEQARPATGVVFDRWVPHTPRSMANAEVLFGRAECAVVRRSPQWTGILSRRPGQVAIVSDVDTRRRLEICFKNPAVQAVITSEPELAHEVRQQLVETGA